MRTVSLWLLVICFYALHQDIWYWRSARPLLFGVFPAGIWYHGVYTLAACGLMAILIRFAWPPEVDELDRAGDGA